MFNSSACKESTFVELLSLQGRVGTLLIFSLVFTIFLYIFEKLGKRSEAISRLKTIDDIPSFRFYSVWMPSIIDILFGVYKIRKDGLSFAIAWWRSIGYSTIFTVKTPFRQIVAITDPKLIKQVLGSPNGQFHHKPKLLYDIAFSEMLKDGLFASHPNIWKPHRKILDQYFTPRKLRSHLKTINKHGIAMIQNLDTSTKDEIKVDQFSPILYDNILSVIMEMLLGQEIMDEMGTREVSYNFRKGKSCIVYRFVNPQNIIPFIWKFNPRRKAYLQTISYFENYIKEAISKSGMAMENQPIHTSDTESGKDLSCIEHMLLHNFNEKEIMDEASSFLIGGHESTNTTCHFILQHLAEHHHIQKKCQDEIDSIFNSNEFNLNVTMDDLSELKYLEQCILETLRLTPSAFGFFREIVQNTQVENYQFKKGTILLFPLLLMNRNPEIYPEPEKFDPDRFLPENIKSRQSYAFLPFSIGPRNCIGWKFAMMQLKTIMAWILRNYGVSTKDKLEDVKLLFDITLSPERQFSLVLHKR